MKSEEASNKVASSLTEELYDLMEELSDEEAGACVGGHDYVHIPIPPLEELTRALVGEGSAEVPIGSESLVLSNKCGGNASVRAYSRR